MRLGKFGFSLFIGSGLAFILGLNTWIGLSFSLIIFLGVLYGQRKTSKEE